MDNALRGQLLEMMSHCLHDIDSALGVWDLVDPQQAQVFAVEIALWVNDWIERSQDLKDLDKLHLLDVLSAKTRILAARTKESPNAADKPQSWQSAKKLLSSLRKLIADYIEVDASTQDHLEKLLLKAK